MRNFIQGVKNLWRWRGIIWRDRDYDYTFLLLIMRFKIEKMSEFFDSDQTITESASAKAQRMRTTAELLTRMIDEHYENEAIAEAADLTDHNPKYDPVFTQMMQEGQQRQEKCDRLVFEILKRDIKTWWD